MELTAVEKETIINYNEAEQTAAVYTHNKSMIRKLNELTRTKPEACKLITTSRGGQAVEYEIPKTWVKIKPPRIASEAQKEAARAALEKSRLQLY